jgi:hypothetical protein
MPLHDWSESDGWNGMDLLWMTELLRYLKSRLPARFRAYLGTGPAVAVGAPSMRPDVGVRERSEIEAHQAARATTEPDIEIAVAALDPAPALFVEREGRLVAAVELVSPRNKGRAVARTTYLGRYASYLIEGVHLLLVDVHRRPAGFSFADGIAAELQMESEPSLAPPLAVSYRVGEPAASGGRMLAIWRRPLTTGGALPSLPLALSTKTAIDIELEATYMRAAADAYMA